ncbi:MAG: hypothetical protein FJY09_11120 [Chlorobi bacterium]|nr:hypothetical protein [Chlorobiota bacterium]
MYFFGDFTWWLMLAAILAMAALPSLIRPFRKTTLLTALLFWSTILAAMWITFDATAALAGFLISAAAGILSFLLAVFFSGLDLMAKKRYR